VANRGGLGSIWRTSLFIRGGVAQWSDIHWDTDQFTATSPKTKRYGKGTRVVPLFPELRPILDEAFTMAREGEEWVVPMLGGEPSKNLGTTFKKIIRRAGVEVWSNPFQNLRLSRQTELEQDLPTYVVCKWLGNTPDVARRHYLIVTEGHFAAAVQNGGLAGDKRGTQPPEIPCKGVHEKTQTPTKSEKTQVFQKLWTFLKTV
jgi:hypothetical protein